MKLVVNGSEMTVREGLLLTDLVRELSLEKKPIAVELNRQVVPRNRFDATRLSENDNLEIITLVGGG